MKLFMCIMASLCFQATLSAQVTQITATLGDYGYLQSYFYSVAPFVSQPTQDVKIGYEDATTHYRTKRGAYLFDLSSLPVNAVITQAQLTIGITFHTTTTGYEPDDFGLVVRALDDQYFNAQGEIDSDIPLFDQAGEGTVFYTLPFDISSTSILAQQTIVKGSPMALALENAAQQYFGIVLRSTDEKGFYENSSNDDSHYMNINQPTVATAVTLTIWYQPNAMFFNDFKVASPQTTTEGSDFQIWEGQYHRELDHGEGDIWVPNQAHDITMHYHQEALYDSNVFPNADDREYNRLEKLWDKYENGVLTPDPDPNNTWETWNDVSIVKPADFTANFYRLVNNEFQLMDLAPGFGQQGTSPITGTNIGIDDDFDGTPDLNAENPIVYQKRNEYQPHEYEVIVPLTIGNGPGTKYFIIWDPDDGGMKANTSIDAQSMTATTTIEPDLHHLDSNGVYGNPYKAYYAQVKAYAFEEDDDITTEVLALMPSGTFVGSFNATEEAWPLTVPKEYTDANGDTYYFVGWWDNTPPSPLT